MKKNKLIALFILFTASVYSQLGEDLYIFGTVQGLYLHEFIDQEVEISRFRVPANGDPNIVIPLDSTKLKSERSTFAIQQFDLFINKFINDRTNIFVDLEFSSNFDSRNNWGALSLRESWLNYSFSNQLNIKAGLFFPAFNNLNEIKNRLNLINYLFRPIPYERLLKEVSNAEDFLPERAFLQIHGAILTKSFFIDYALYMGNSETSAISTNTDPDYLSGVDQGDLEKKLYGARIGFRNKKETVKFGVSGTRDYNNGNNFLGDQLLFGFDSLFTEAERKATINDQLRLRIGFDLNVIYDDFTLEAEYSFSELEDFSFSDLNVPENLFNSLHAWNRFFYWTLHYDINDDIFSYIGASEISYEILGFISDANYLTLGGGYRIDPNLILKAQYIVYYQKTDFALPSINNGNVKLNAFTNVKGELYNNFLMVGFTANF